jgi:hypothetical protein
MPITYLAAGTGSQNNGGTNPVPTLPAGCSASTVNVCVIYSRGSVDESVSMPAGWTQALQSRTSGGMLAVFTRPWESGDTDPTVTLTNFTGGTTGDSVAARIFGFNGVSRSAPVAQVGTVSTNASQANIGAISGLTLASKPTATVLVIGGRRDDGLSASALSGDGLTWTEVHDAAVTAGADAHMVVSYAIDATGGTTVTNKTFTMSGVVNAEGMGVMLELAPASAGQRFKAQAVIA